MITCLIIDDEPSNISILKRMIADYCTGVEVAGSANNTDSALELIAELNPQLVFLDIEMHTNNAFELLDKLMPVRFEIIFVTAYDNYALKAFRYSALDYLLKPVDIDELKLAIEKARERIAAQNINHRLNDFISQLPEKNKVPKIGLRSKDGLLFQDIEDIISCSAEGAYTNFEFVKGKALLVSGTLKVFENTLPADCFCRVHDSYLVNLHHVKKYHYGKGGYVEMVNGATIPVSLRKRADFLSRIRY